MLIFYLFFRINLTINVAHPVFLMHTQSLLSGYTPAYYIKLYKYIHFLLLYLQFCDHSKRILTD